MLMRTVARAVMEGTRLWLALATLQVALTTTSCVKLHRRSMPTPSTFPVTKGGWRPVLSSGILPGYGAFGAAPLHASPSYKIPVPVLDAYASSSRPVVARDATKLTSIAQSYRPTTLRSLPSTAATNQPINTYFNPFSFNQAPNHGLSHYKFVQSYPVENVVIRNPQNPYQARPVFSKYPQQKHKQSFNAALQQQLNSVQPIQFGAQTYQKQEKPQEAKKPQTSHGTEVFKPEVYKLDSDAAPQSVSAQQVQTQQQQQLQNQQQQQVQYQQQQQQQQQHNLAGLKPVSYYPQYQFKDEKFAPLPASVLGSFNGYAIQSLKGRDPIYNTGTKTTYYPPQPTKHTIFNSFSFTPTYKTTANQFHATTPKLQTTLNQLNYVPQLNDIKAPSTQPPKVSTSLKADPNAGYQFNFKASPQDPFAKPYHTIDLNKYQVSTYNPNTHSTPSVLNYYNSEFTNRFPPQKDIQTTYYNQQPFNQENKKHKIHDSLTSSGNQQPASQFPNAPYKKPEHQSTQNASPLRATYEVTENADSDVVTIPTSNTWSAIPVGNEFNNDHQKPSFEELATRPEYNDGFDKPTTSVAELPEEYSIVTEGEKPYENSLSYDSHVETQSRRPLGDDFEPIGKHKLKEYYYKVSTPTYDEVTHYKRPKPKPTEATSAAYSQQELTTNLNSNKDTDITDALPTLPPNQHFKRPTAPQGQDPMEKDKVRKRIKHRRRRPPLANLNHEKQETSTRRSVQVATESPQPTETEEIHTIRPRPKVTKQKPQVNLTTPTISTDLSTSALPTISPTSPTVVKKKIGHRRHQTSTGEKPETTTSIYEENDSNKDSSIMKIANRQQYPKVTTIRYDYKPSEFTDYSHKQDEKDTPTSDISVSLTESLKTRPEPPRQFSFHKDVKPIEAKLEAIKETTTQSLKQDSETEASTTTLKTENTSEKSQRPRIKHKYETNRPKFSVKDYRNRLSSTTSTTEKPAENQGPKIRFPQRRLPYENKFTSESDNATDRKKFTPKDPRHKYDNSSDGEPLAENELHSTRQPPRQRHTSTTEHSEGTTQKMSSRIRNGSRRPKPTTEETAETLAPTTVHIKRPLRKKIKDSELGESVQDISVTEAVAHNDHKDDITSERSRSESAIMKIAKDDKRHPSDHVDHIFEHSKRVSDLTLAASKDYNTPGMFKTVSPNSRRIPNYFTIATDDPILPIEAFFPQLNQKKES